MRSSGARRKGEAGRVAPSVFPLATHFWHARGQSGMHNGQGAGATRNMKNTERGGEDS
jgi:hypothetical protein